MSKEVEFVIQGTISTKARPRARIVNGKYAQMYTPKTTANYENLVKVCYQNQTEMYFCDKPLLVEIRAYFLPSDANKKYVAHGLRCINHKDLDNIAKTILDALNGIAYIDDKQVCQLNISKSYSYIEKEFVSVSIKELDGTIEEAKNNYQRAKEYEKYLELTKKEKLTKSQKKKLQELENMFGYMFEEERKD